MVSTKAVVLVSHLYIDFVNKQSAEKAYYAGDYMECYSLLFGQDRSIIAIICLLLHGVNKSRIRFFLFLRQQILKGNYRFLLFFRLTV